MNDLRFAIQSTVALAMGLAFLSTGGCYVRTSTRTASNPPPTTSTTVAQDPPPPQQTGVTMLETSCVQGGQEICNGLDDNCDGQIDEGCGYSSGNIQVTLSWNTGADLDLYIYDPTGARIYYSDRNSASGGVLDQDARGACNPNQANNTIENVYYDAAQPPSGQYTAEVHYWAGSECSSNAGPTNGVVTISVGGQILGSYQMMLAPDQRSVFATFELP